MRRLISAVTVGLALVLFAPAPAYAGTANPTLEDQFVARVNSERAARGLPLLSVDSQLRDVARGWAQQMADAGGISHNPNLAAQAPARWTRLGENVGRGSEVESLHQAFVASPAHLANIVDPQWETVGIGVIEQGGYIWVVEQFMFAPAPQAPRQASAAATLAARRGSSRPSRPSRHHAARVRRARRR